MLVVTGGFLNAGETSVLRAVRKQLAQWRAADDAWLDLKVKLVGAEPLVLAKAHAPTSAVAREYLAREENVATPELTEALLATLLRDEGAPYALATTDEVLAGSPRVAALADSCACVFLSATMLRDLSELEPLVALLKRPTNKVVVGGALAGAIAADFDGLDSLDVLAVGYGEHLVPTLVAWMRAGFGPLAPPKGGRVESRGPSLVLHAPLPEGLSLDDLPIADWALSQRDHGRSYRMIHYESVRGCPYRCAFCNYPFLFDDQRFRTRSARRMADDWQRYVEELDVEFINCLDSLFTMPKRRLLEFCDLLTEREIRVKWICYARADDLADEEVVKRMRRAGAHLVHIGIESGDQGQLDRMNKRCTVEANARALRNCRAHGLTTLASFVVGFPGETEETLARTYEFLRATPPDFHYLAVFNTRIEAVPVLAPESRARFGLRSARNPRTTAPYWAHDTMDCREACQHARDLERRLAVERVSLNAAVFYKGLLSFDASQREPLLDHQRDATVGHGGIRRTLDGLHRLVDKRLARGIAALPQVAEVARA